MSKTIICTVKKQPSIYDGEGLIYTTSFPCPKEYKRGYTLFIPIIAPCMDELLQKLEKMKVDFWLENNNTFPIRLFDITDFSNNEVLTFESLLFLGDSTDTAYKTVINDREEEAKKESSKDFYRFAYTN